MTGRSTVATMETEECYWGGPATDGCWTVAGCGCQPTTVEGVWREAHVEHLRHLWREVFDSLADALRISQFVDWLSRRLR